MKYKYIDETPRDYPTLGYREVKKDDIIESEVEINSPYLELLEENKKGADE